MVFLTLIKRVFLTPYGESGKSLMSDAVPNALCMASEIRCIFNLIWPILDVDWPTRASGVGNTLFPDATLDAVCMASEIPLFPMFFVLTSFLASKNLCFLVVKHKENVRPMEDMRKMIEKLTRAQRAP